MFELETILKQLPLDYDTDIYDTDITLSIESAREIADKFSTIRTALRRIVSLDEKNVEKYAKQIAAEALQKSS